MSNLILTILFGYLGTYRFSKKQNKLGFVYLFTCGLFGIGWIYDIYLAYLDYKKSQKRFTDSTHQKQSQENFIEKNNTDTRIVSQTEETSHNIENGSKSVKKDDCVTKPTNLMNGDKLMNFCSDILLKNYAYERIENLIKEDIDNEYLTKSDLYSGFSNSEIEEIGKTYRLENYSMECDLEPFADSYKYGVYLKNVSGKKLFVGYLPDEKTDEVRKISLFGKVIRGGAILNGGKFKEYDFDKGKVVTNTESYRVEIRLTYSLPNDADKKMTAILLEEQEDAKKYKIINTEIAGVFHDNDDGTSRKEIADGIEEGALLHLENYFYEKNKAVKILTKDNRLIGHIPAQLAESIYDYNEDDRIGKVEFAPHYFDGRITDYKVKIYVKK